MIPLSTSIPLILRDPYVLGIREVKTPKVVDFPAPFGPSSPKISPLPIQNLVFFIARQPESYFFINPLTLIASPPSLSTLYISSFT